LAVLGALAVFRALGSDDGENTTHSSLESRSCSLHPCLGTTKCDDVVSAMQCVFHTDIDYYVEIK
jgi:hypothetical protein